MRPGRFYESRRRHDYEIQPSSRRRESLSRRRPTSSRLACAGGHRITLAAALSNSVLPDSRPQLQTSEGFNSDALNLAANFNFPTRSLHAALKVSAKYVDDYVTSPARRSRRWLQIDLANCCVRIAVARPPVDSHTFLRLALLSISRAKLRQTRRASKGTGPFS